MSDTPIYDGTNAGNAPEPPPPVNAQPNLAGDVERIIAGKIAEVEAKYADRISQLEAQLKAAGTPFAGVNAEHAAGPSYEVMPAWSLRLQEMARAGQITEEILAEAGKIAEAV